MLILVSTVTGCVSILTFTSLAAAFVGITSFAVALYISAYTARIKKYKSIITKKKMKKHDKKELLGKAKLDNNKVLISEVLINFYISHGEFVSVR